jgi:hypothetical protein
MNRQVPTTRPPLRESGHPADRTVGAANDSDKCRVWSWPLVPLDGGAPRLDPVTFSIHHSPRNVVRSGSVGSSGLQPVAPVLVKLPGFSPTAVRDVRPARRRCRRT